MLRRRTKLFYTIFDFYANNLQQNDNIFTRIISKIVAYLEKLGIRFTDNLFLVDKCRYENIKGASIKNLDIVYNSPPDLFNQTINNYKNDKGNTDKKKITLFYAGSLHRSRGLFYIIKAIRDMENIKLKIAGSGPLRDFIMEIARERNNVEYLGFLNYDEVIKQEINSDILFAFYNPKLPNSRLASPNKLFEAMMCQKPIIINSKIAAASIVKKENCGIIVNYGNVSELKEALKVLSIDSNLREKLGKNGRKAYEKTYSWKMMKKKLLQAYLRTKG